MLKDELKRKKMNSKRKEARNKFGKECEENKAEWRRMSK